MLKVGDLDVLQRLALKEMDDFPASFERMSSKVSPSCVCPESSAKTYLSKCIFFSLQNS